LKQIARILYSKRYIRTFIVNRKTGSWLNGRFIETESSISLNGIVTTATSEDVNQVPEGDRVSEMLCFYSDKEMFVTHNEASFKGTSDQISWRNNRYRVLSVQFHDLGYFKAIGAYMGGD